MSKHSGWTEAKLRVVVQASAGKGTRDIAGSAPWEGTESLHDISLRMLDDSKKKQPISFKAPRRLDTPPVKFERSPGPPKSPGLRIARAKEKSAAYTQSRTEGISDKERDSFRREIKDRFSPGFSMAPYSVHGLASLANERIEDAIAGGHFKAIPRGKGVNVDPDHTANNAFLDTTEYLMNKMVKRQDLVPPWIEKQQEANREVGKFRERLRVEWRRHAARLIASKGGSLESQMQRARGHAAAEVRLAEGAKAEALFRDDGENERSQPENHDHSQTASENIPYLPPLRDENYLGVERSFHELMVKHLNSLIRSYNLQAPPVAQRPYLNLERELTSCFADVAPTLADEIKRRATERVRPSSSIGPNSPGVLGTLGVGHPARVYDEDKSKTYGFKELWKDLFSRGSNSA